MRLTVLAATALALVGLVTAPAASASTGLARFYDQKVNWTKCQQGPDDDIGKQLDEAGGDCADLTVPLDYQKPGGRTITVAISRIKATERPLGPMVLNGGGPGGIGLDMPLVVRGGMGAVGRRYDLIGMDPRFIGRSTPLDCDWPVGSSARAAGPDRASFNRSVQAAKDLANACAPYKDVLPHVTTRDTARDMDVVRGVLGARKLHYLGYSYGSYLGAVYLEMFEHRAGRIVLDGPSHPDLHGPNLLSSSGPANEKALAAWASWTASRHATYGLGTTRDEVLATVHRVIAASSEHPLRIGEHVVDDAAVPVLIYAGLGSDQDGPRADLAGAVRNFADAVDHGSATPTEWLDQNLRFFLSGLESDYASSQSAVLCGDRAAWQGVERYWRDIERSRETVPTFASTVYNIGPCVFWPVRPKERPTRIHTDVPVLMVAAAGDPRTIYENAEALRGGLTGTRLITLRDANVHGVYLEYGNDCVDVAVNKYLDTGKLPASDLTCQASPEQRK